MQLLQSRALPLGYPAIRSFRLMTTLGTLKLNNSSEMLFVKFFLLLKPQNCSSLSLNITLNEVIEP